MKMQSDAGATIALKLINSSHEVLAKRLQHLFTTNCVQQTLTVSTSYSHRSWAPQSLQNTWHHQFSKFSR